MSDRRRQKTAVTCACGVRFFPYRRQRKGPASCSMRCRNLAISQRQKGQRLTAAIAGLKRRARYRVEAATRELFGRLSAREVELFNYALALGRKRGRDQRYYGERAA